MSTTGTIETLFKDREQAQAVYPVTKVNAVSDESGKGLNVILEEHKDYTRKIGAAYNLLDNSDFRNPVNQRGSASYSGKVYGIDRWKSNTGELVVTVADGYLQLTHSTSASARASFSQNLGTGYVGRTFTVAICVHDTGNVYCASATVPNPTSSTQNFGSVSFNGSSARMDLNSDGELFYTIMVGRTEGENVLNVRWVALYEGEYTAETLPEYQPKGYAVELAECQRYFERIKAHISGYYNFASMTIQSDTTALGQLYYSPKRISPTLTTNGTFRLRGSTSITNITNFSFAAHGTTGAGVTVTISGGTAGQSAVLQANNDTSTYIDVSADL